MMLTLLWLSDWGFCLAGSWRLSKMSVIKMVFFFCGKLSYGFGLAQSLYDPCNYFRYEELNFLSTLIQSP